MNYKGMDKHKKPPQTVTEVGIHVGYLREDVSDIKTLLESHMELAATKVEVRTLERRVTKLETTLDKIKNRIISAAITIFVLMVLAMYGLDKFFR